MSVLIGINTTTFSDSVNRRLVGGLLLSILVHALVLSMQFGIPGLGLPGLELPWKERRTNLPPITILIANTQQASVPAKPIVAITEPPSLPIVVPAPIIPLLKPAPHIDANTGMRLFDAVVPNKLVTMPKKTIQGKHTQISPPQPPQNRLARPAVDLPDTPTRVIAQDQIRDDNFAVPVPDTDEPIRKSNANQSTKENAKLTAAETFDQTELSEEELAKSVELKIAKEIEKENAEKEQMEKLLKQARKLADQLAEKQVEQKKRELDEALAAQVIEKQIIAKKLEEEKQKQQVARQVEEAAKQQDIVFALQKKLETEEQAKRLQKQDALRLEAQRKELQLVQDLETRKQIEAQEKQQAAIRQKQLDEQVIKQKSEQLAARKVAEQKLAEQKLAEQKLAEQKLAEQKLAEQKLAEQKLAEQKLAEQRATDQRIAEQRAAAQRDRALADAAAVSKANVAGSSANANGSAGAGGTNLVLPRNNFSSDLANRAREQSKGWDVLSGTPPAPRQAGPDLNSRRRSILGSFDREVPLRMYVESWRQKVERNGNFNYSQTSKDKSRGDPVVIVAIRSDGSVEDVTIVRSSGRADIDEAVSRIVRLNAPYAVFPQNIAAKYDVIEIRRVWRFDETLRIVEEVR
jgi:TonB family protein